MAGEWVEVGALKLQELIFSTILWGSPPVVRAWAKVLKEKSDKQTQKETHFFPFFCYDSETEKWKEEKTPLIVLFLLFTRFPYILIQWS